MGSDRQRLPLSSLSPALTSPSRTPGRPLHVTEFPAASVQAHTLRALQSLAGNTAVQRLLSVQRQVPASSPAITAAALVPLILEDPEYKKWAGLLAGQCAPSTQAIGSWLAELGYQVQYRGIVMVSPPLGPRGKNATLERELNLVTRLNLNHFVVTVSVRGTKVIIDPTQGQFDGGGSPQVDLEPAWVDRFQSLTCKGPKGTELYIRPSKYLDADSFEEARVLAHAQKPYADIGGAALRPPLPATEEAARNLWEP